MRSLEFFVSLTVPDSAFNRNEGQEYFLFADYLDTRKRQAPGTLKTSTDIAFTFTLRSLLKY
jgi:hypothetical protein